MPQSSSIVALCCGLVLLCGSVIAQPPQPETPRAQSGRSDSAPPAMTPADAQQLQAALSDYNAGNLAQAQPVLVALAARYPRHAQVQAAAGMTLAEQGDVAGALPLLQRAHSLAPRNPQYAVNLAVAELKTGHASDAIVLLQGAAQAQPRDSAIRVSLAQAQLQAGQKAAAAASFERVEALTRAEGHASDADLRHDWAVALLGANRGAEAVTVLQAAPDAANTAAVQELLGEAEEKNGHYEAAVKHLQRAAELDASEPNLYAYGNELMQHWTFPAAIQVLHFATARYPRSDRLQMALGIAYFGNNSYDSAIPIFDTLLQKQPDSSAAADLLGRSCSALSGAQQPGCAALQTFARAHPGNAPASLYAAIAILHQPAEAQDTAAAASLLQNALQADPKLAEAWYELGALQQTQNQWTESAMSLQRAIDARAAYPEAHYRLARAYSHLGRRDEAQQQIALQQKYAAEAKAAENKRMQEVMTFLTTSN